MSPMTYIDPPARLGPAKPGGTTPAISIQGVTKTYASGFQALRDIDLDIQPGEIFALLGPNGAGKTTLISIICGIVTATAGRVTAAGFDITRDYRAARRIIGLVPQELTTDAFETVRATVSFSRGLFGYPPNPAHIEKTLRDLSLWDKRDSKIITLSGGMKRRVMIAKALAHEPRILFLDEPSAGVDVELRRDMWQMVRALRASGVTIILTTHYIEEAEEMADRIGVISQGRIILVEDKAMLMQKLGKTQLTLKIQPPLAALPPALADWPLERSADGTALVYTYDAQSGGTGIAALMRQIDALGIEVRNLQTKQSSLEDIFVSLVHAAVMNPYAIRSIYVFEMNRTRRTLLQSIVSPVISTALYFVVFGSAMGAHMGQVGGTSYGAFIVPGLIMLSLLTQSIANASFSIYFPKFTGTIYELLSAPVSAFEIVAGYVGAAASKSLLLGLIILATARLFVPFGIAHPAWMVAFLVLTSVTFSLFGFIIGIWADSFEKLNLVPAPDRHPADLLGRQLLLDRHAAALLAEGDAVQPGRIPDQRLPLELLRAGGYRRGCQPGHDAGVHGAVPGGDLVDLPHGVSAEAVMLVWRGGGMCTLGCFAPKLADAAQDLAA